MATETNGRVTTVSATEEGEIAVSAPDDKGQLRTATFTPEEAFSLATELLNNIRKATGNGPAPMERISAVRGTADSLYQSEDAVEGLYAKVDALHTALDLEQRKTRKLVARAAERAEDAERVLLLISGTASRAIRAHARKYGEDWSV